MLFKTTLQCFRVSPFSAKTAGALVLLASASSGLVQAGDYAGIVSASSPFRLDRSLTASGATVFPGSLLETLQSSARLRFATGTSVELSPETSALVYQDRARLESGSAAVSSSKPFQVDVRSLHVQFSDGRSRGNVSIHGQTVQVAMLEGDAIVSKDRGVVVGRISASQMLAFREMPGQGPASMGVTGTLQRAGDSFRLRDETSHVQVDLEGADLARFAGKRVQASGVMKDKDPAQGNPILVAVNRIALADALPDTQDAGAAAAAGILNITIEEGDEAINNIKGRVAREVIVKVDDENHKPVSGAAVLLALPRSGPGGKFATGGQTFNGTTDAAGRVVVKFTPNKVAGQYKIQVEASDGTRKGSRSFNQSNVLSAAAAGSAAAAAGVGAGGAAGAGAGGSTAAGAGLSTALIAGIGVLALAGPIAAAIKISQDTAPTISPIVQ